MRCALAMVAVLLLSASGLAQREARATQDDVPAAARAFQSGQKAQLAGDFARAAELFELADVLAPTPEAVRSAMRNREAAGQPARAATIALEAKQRYPDDAQTVAAANELLDRVAASLSRVSVTCEPLCTVLIDGQALTLEPVSRAEAYVPAGEHRVEARFGAGRRAVEALALVPGQERALELRAPAAKAPNPSGASAPGTRSTAQ